MFEQIIDYLQKFSFCKLDWDGGEKLARDIKCANVQSVAAGL